MIQKIFNATVKLGQIFILVVSSTSFAVSTNTSDEVLSIIADRMIGTNQDKSVKFFSNIRISFKDYIVYTNEAFVRFVYVGQSKKIDKILIPTSVILINRRDSSEIMMADSAEYLREFKTMVIKGNVRLKKNNSVFVVNELVIYLADLGI